VPACFRPEGKKTGGRKEEPVAHKRQGASEGGAARKKRAAGGRRYPGTKRKGWSGGSQKRLWDEGGPSKKRGFRLFLNNFPLKRGVSLKHHYSFGRWRSNATGGVAFSFLKKPLIIIKRGREVYYKAPSF